MATANPRNELEQYLKSGAEKTEDVIKWWGVRISFFSLIFILFDNLSLSSK